ncbi:MAG: ABC transporter ATP-binding protein [Pseudolabrys sp.]|jgi:branched-chain amino acid transport system ATP-binding protein|nr:ABC transporter ATP-binding protein [Pseudolabrys sp.]
MSTLSIRGLRSGYGKIEVLHDVTLDVARGQIVTLIGANGAGKTTLLKTISGLLRPSAGSITFEGKSIVRRPPHKIVELGISHVPEGRAILKRMTVIDNLRMGAYVRTDSEIAEDIEAALARFPLLSERRLQIAGTLSGGEQQMLAIGRALVARPRLLLFDEPSLGLAPKIVSQIFLTLRELKNEGKTILLVEQNARQALRVADHGYVLERGRIIYSGSGEELLNMPEVQRTYLGQSAA